MIETANWTENRIFDIGLLELFLTKKNPKVSVKIPYPLIGTGIAFNAAKPDPRISILMKVNNVPIFQIIPFLIGNNRTWDFDLALIFSIGQEICFEGRNLKSKLRIILKYHKAS